MGGDWTRRYRELAARQEAGWNVVCGVLLGRLRRSADVPCLAGASTCKPTRLAGCIAQISSPLLRQIHYAWLLSRGCGYLLVAGSVVVTLGLAGAPRMTLPPCLAQILKFVGCYHGHADQFLVQAGSGVITLGLADSPGVPAATAAATLTATYNDLDSVRAIFEANKGEIAGVILEPVVGNSGFIVPTQEFLDGLRQITKEVRLGWWRHEQSVCVCWGTGGS